MVSNLVMFLAFVGAAGSTTQALRALDSVGVCADSAAQRLGVRYLSASEPRFVDADTLEFRAAEPDGRTLQVRCTLGAGDDTDGPLPVTAVEVVG